MYVTKADGRKERFDEKKIMGTCLRAGADKKTAKRIAETVKKRVYDGISTHDLYKMVLQELEKLEPKSSFFYTIRDAIADLDSQSFELFVKKLLEAHGYACVWDKKIQGNCVEHQVDIIAEKDGMKFLVECKRHFNPHRFSGLGTSLQIQARLDDIKQGFVKGLNKYDFDHAWLFVNTKFSDHAKKYSRCKGMCLTGWRYPEKDSLEELVHVKKIYPLTILKTRADVKRRLLRARIITLFDFLNQGPEKLIRITKLDNYQIQNLVKQAKNLTR